MNSNKSVGATVKEMYCPNCLRRMRKVDGIDRPGRLGRRHWLCGGCGLRLSNWKSKILKHGHGKRSDKYRDTVLKALIREQQRDDR